MKRLAQIRLSIPEIAPQREVYRSCFVHLLSV
jgi:hypothetical protein